MSSAFSLLSTPGLGTPVLLILLSGIVLRAAPSMILVFACHVLVCDSYPILNPTSRLTVLSQRRFTTRKLPEDQQVDIYE